MRVSHMPDTSQYECMCCRRAPQITMARKQRFRIKLTWCWTTGKAAAAKAEELGVGKGNQNLQFSQLMGMADALSFGLKNAGFQVSKYLPYGTVDQVIPYLLRRAEENRGMLSSSSLDRELIRLEIFYKLLLSKNLWHCAFSHF